jgi:hypothetical protein
LSDNLLQGIFYSNKGDDLKWKTLSTK